MGLGAGGAIRQKIYPDPYIKGRSVAEIWNDEPAEKAYIYIVHSGDFKSIVGYDPPPTPITHQFYQANGYPWFALSDGTWGDVDGATKFEKVKPVSGGPDPVIADAPGSVPNPLTKDLWE